MSQFEKPKIPTVAYYRVSTEKQGRSGLGLDAQRAIIKHNADVYNLEIVSEFEEVMSGGSMIERFQLKRAIKYCVETGATLIVAKVDRLSRNIRDTFSIVEALNKRLICCDIPSQNGTTDTMMLSIFAAVSQKERELISIRTSQAMQQAKLRGKTFGRVENLTNEVSMAKSKATRKRSWLNNENSLRLKAFVSELYKQDLTVSEMVERLREAHFTTATGKEITLENLYGVMYGASGLSMEKLGIVGKQKEVPSFEVWSKDVLKNDDTYHAHKYIIEADTKLTRKEMLAKLKKLKERTLASKEYQIAYTKYRSGFGRRGRVRMDADKLEAELAELAYKKSLKKRRAKRVRRRSKNGNGLEISE